MKDRLDAGQGGIERIAAQVERMKVKGRMTAKTSEIGLLDRARIIRDKGIEANDGVVVPQQLLAQMRADESGSAGDETFHAWFLPWASCDLASKRRL